MDLKNSQLETTKKVEILLHFFKMIVSSNTIKGCFSSFTKKSQKRKEKSMTKIILLQIKHVPQ